MTTKQITVRILDEEEIKEAIRRYLLDKLKNDGYVQSLDDIELLCDVNLSQLPISAKITQTK